MRDHRLIIAVVGAVVAFGAGVVGIVQGSAVPGVVAGVAGAVAGAAGIALAGRLRLAEQDADTATRDVERLQRELDAVAAILAEETTRLKANGGTSTPEKEDDRAFDAATGLYDERYFAVLVQQQVAAARRSLRPVSVVLFEADRLQEADPTTREQALALIGDVVRRTLRESDSACRLGDLMVGAILEDTAEAGAVWAAERVRGTLLASPVGDALTLSAGVSCYPTHALGAVELVQQAGRALEEARARGRDRVELAPEAS